LLGKIAALTHQLEFPVIAKSVGSGISVSTARRLLEAGVAAIDVAGAGGTSWARVEGRRSEDPRRLALAESFAGWGVPTAELTRRLRAAFAQTPLIASGGVRSGVDIARALALGANLAGIGLPLLEPATRSAAAVAEHLFLLVDGLRIAMFASGCTQTRDLRYALDSRGSDETEIVDPST
ncbi:MAG TPA: alpha-hydroxy-acid oxidizing protein, partial [Candidatus Acidoferrales bacterium]|nr:alpha-hydroxy-acid oxidizing protein [Candidatus Acidoferrales bacterium]